ncbi:MAG: hypothetical protein II505_08200, partial [Bacteroidaceae bacterium]|nr:hypothetical protein [Bacteroidaceae bacterium]
SFACRFAASRTDGLEISNALPDGVTCTEDCFDVRIAHSIGAETSIASRRFARGACCRCSFYRSFAGS